jgi:hypothetical protein
MQVGRISTQEIFPNQYDNFYDDDKSNNNKGAVGVGIYVKGTCHDSCS